MGRSDEDADAALPKGPIGDLSPDRSHSTVRGRAAPVGGRFGPRAAPSDGHRGRVIRTADVPPLLHRPDLASTTPEVEYAEPDVSMASDVGRQLVAQLRAGSDGQRFGPYWLLDPIGAGGMAEVRLAYEELSNGDVRPCVVKRISAAHLDKDDFVEMFREEARIGQVLRHPNIVQMYAAGEIERIPFICFELVDGITAADIDSLDASGQVPESIVVHIATKVATALAYAHSLTASDGAPLSLVHRDVSPQNILLDRTGAVKLADFGIARFEGRAHETQAGHFKGKMRYVAPEQFRMIAPDARADLFSLGVVMAELLAGVAIFPAGAISVDDTAGTVQATLTRTDVNVSSAGLIDLIARLTSERPEHRPDYAEAVLRDLDVIADGLTTPEPRMYFERLFARLPAAEDQAIARASTAVHVDHGVAPSAPAAGPVPLGSFDAAPPRFPTSYGVFGAGSDTEATLPADEKADEDVAEPYITFGDGPEDATRRVVSATGDVDDDDPYWMEDTRSEDTLEPAPVEQIIARPQARKPAREVHSSQPAPVVAPNARPLTPAPTSSKLTSIAAAMVILALLLVGAAAFVTYFAG